MEHEVGNYVFEFLVEGVDKLLEALRADRSILLPVDCLFGARIDYQTDLDAPFIVVFHLVPRVVVLEVRAFGNKPELLFLVAKIAVKHVAVFLFQSFD